MNHWSVSLDGTFVGMFLSLYYKLRKIWKLTWQKGQVKDLSLVLGQVGDALAGDAPLFATLRSEVAENKFAVLGQDRLKTETEGPIFCSIHPY